VNGNKHYNNVPSFSESEWRGIRGRTRESLDTTPIVIKSPTTWQSYPEKPKRSDTSYRHYLRKTTQQNWKSSSYMYNDLSRSLNIIREHAFQPTKY